MGRRRAYSVEIQHEAARLRGEGIGRADIARRLGVSFSTICRWFRQDGVAVPVAYRGATRAQQAAVAERWTRQQTEQDAHRDAVGPLSSRELLLVGATLYWAEGSKSKPWNRSHRVLFVNSDTGVITVFLAWLHLMGVARARLRCALMIHESANVTAAEQYWRDVVGHDVKFSRTTLKRHRPLTTRKNTAGQYRGCLAIRVLGSGDLYRQTAGTWEGVVQAVASTARHGQSPVV